MAKPDPEIFEVLEDRIGHSPGRLRLHRRQPPQRRGRGGRRHGRHPLHRHRAPARGPARARAARGAGRARQRAPHRLGGARTTARCKDPPVSIKDIRLFGDPVLRTPAAEVVDFDKELRQLVKDLDRHDARRAGRRARRPADRRRAARLHLLRRRRARPPGQPRASTSPTDVQDGPEGCLSFPGLRFDTPRALRVVAKGCEHVRRAGRRSRAPSCWPAASSTRPTTSTASCSSTGMDPGPAQAGDEGHPRGRVGR